MTDTIDAALALLPSGWARDVRLEITDGWITHVETDVAGLGASAIALVPGGINAHADSLARGMVGRGERYSGAESDADWRERLARRLLNATPDALAAIAAFAYAEMLEGGFTGAAEFVRVHNAPSGTAYDDVGEILSHVLEAGEQAGLALTLLPAGQTFGAPGDARSQPYERRSIVGPERFLRLCERARALTDGAENASAGVGFASPWAVPHEAMREAITAHDGPAQIVVGERNREALATMTWAGKRGTVWLDETLGLSPRWSIAHANHMTDDEARRLAASGGVMVACASHGLRTGAGTPALPRYTPHGGLLALGTAATPRSGLAHEIDALESAQRLRDRARASAWHITQDPDQPGLGRTVFDACLTGGVQVTQRRTGRLDLGYRADVVALDLTDIDLAGRAGDAILDGWLLGAGRDAVRHVWCAGRQRVEDGRHVERERLQAAYLAAVKGLADV